MNALGDADGLRLLIRADASTDMGSGHVMRCLALVEHWRSRGGDVAIASQAMPSALRDRLKRMDARLVSLAEDPKSVAGAEETARVARTCSADWLVVDGYHLDETYEEAGHAVSLRVLRVDDLGQLPLYTAEIVLNQNLGATEETYRLRSTHTQVLAGPNFVLLRREFTERPPSGIRSVGDRVLITMGGGDAAGFTSTAMRSLLTMSSKPQLRATLGPLSQAADLAQEGVELVRDGAMPDLIRWADVVVTAGGSTCWEVAHLGVPMIVVPLAANQVPTAAALAAAGIARQVVPDGHGTAPGLTDHVDDLLTDAGVRMQMSRKAKALIDGQGASRVVDVMLGRLRRPV